MKYLYVCYALLIVSGATMLNYHHVHNRQPDGSYSSSGSSSGSGSRLGSGSYGSSHK
jgi:hypothetical protein